LVGDERQQEKYKLWLMGRFVHGGSWDATFLFAKKWNFFVELNATCLFVPRCVRTWGERPGGVRVPVAEKRAGASNSKGPHVFPGSRSADP
jgi:hypothetical protein